MPRSTADPTLDEPGSPGGVLTRARRDHVERLLPRGEGRSATGPGARP